MVPQRMQLYSHVKAEAMRLSDAYSGSHAHCPRKDRMHYTNWVCGSRSLGALGLLEFGSDWFGIIRHFLELCGVIGRDCNTFCRIQHAASVW